MHSILRETMSEDNIEGQFNYVYPMTTENIKGYFPFINNISKVLCVASSGDHLLNCVAKGAKEVTLFDVNPITYYLTKLKIAALNLSREEFISFFTVPEHWDIHSDAFFNKNTFISLKWYLDDETYSFWVAFYKILDEKKYTPQTSRLFRHMRHPRETIVEANIYLDVDIYDSMKYRIKDTKWDFVESDILNLGSTLKENERYNTILFSNISDYIQGVFNCEGFSVLDKYEEFTDKLVRERLAFGGQLFYAYIYQAMTGPGWSPIDVIAELPLHFNPLILKTFPAFCRRYTSDFSCVDCVLIKERNEVGINGRRII